MTLYSLVLKTPNDTSSQIICYPGMNQWLD
jgi:hypothetical protein